jgi:hypothetical protein
MSFVEIMLLIRTLAEAIPRLATILARVEARAGKPLEEMNDAELVAFLQLETQSTESLIEEGRDRARRDG